MKSFNRLLNVLTIAAAAMTTATSSVRAQNLKVLHAFSVPTNGTNWDGLQPHSDLVLAADNTLYGTTPLGGSNGLGTVFSIKTDGTGFTVLHTFSGAADGAAPNKSLVLAGNTLFGLVGRGTNLSGFGSVYSMRTDGGDFTNFYTFSDASDGSLGQPNGGLVLNGDTLYGTAYQGGISNWGTIFSVTANGVFNLLHQFDSGTEGKNPLGTLVLAGDTLYGTARNGGSNGLNGTLFSINTNSGSFSVLHTFGSSTAPDGHTPDAGLILSGATLYGTAFGGGTNNFGTVYSINTNGDGFAVVYTFAAPGPKLPEAGVMLRGDTLYGTTLEIGNNLSGTVYSLNTNGTGVTVLHAFSPPNSSFGFTNLDGAEPYGGVAMGGNVLYGTTSVGGTNGSGVVYALTVAPKITGLALAGTNLLVSGINGVAGSTYALLASTNVALPLSEWLPVATNGLSGGGSFSFTATNAVRANLGKEFYILRTQ